MRRLAVQASNLVFWGLLLLVRASAAQTEKYFLSDAAGPWHETDLCGGDGARLATWEGPGERDELINRFHELGVQREEDPI